MLYTSNTYMSIVMCIDCYGKTFSMPLKSGDKLSAITENHEISPKIVTQLLSSLTITSAIS